jgi:tRNA(fMet)-specific endonuclease VapC
MIIVDTDVLIEIFDKGSDVGDEALERILKSSETIAITSINLHEILYGLYNYAKPVKDVMQLPVLDYMKKDATLAARIELDVEKRGATIRRTDVMIAAIAINNGASLYTLDLKHFKPLTDCGLKLFP